MIRCALLLGISLAAPRAQEPVAVDSFRPVAVFVTDEMAAARLPFVAVAIATEDGVRARGFGIDPRSGAAASGETVFRAASISKLFTAISVMQLVEKGALDLDRPVREIVDDFRPVNRSAVPITLRHLLAHRSGLVREPAAGHYFESGNSLAAVVRSLAGRRLVYAPGERFKYSNAGVSVAGHAVATVAGRPFAEHVREAILEPLGLENSSFDHRSEIAARCAQGTMWTLDGREFPAPTFPLGMVPAANLYTTVEDLARFAQSLFLTGSDRVRAVRAATLRSMFEPQFGGPVGIGFFVDRFDGRRRVRHGGAIYGFASELEILPDDGLAVAVVTNVDCANGSASRIAEFALRATIAGRAGREPPAVDRPVRLGRDAARGLAGRYEDADSWIELEERDGELWGFPSSGPAVLYRRSGLGIVGDGRAAGRWGATRIEPVAGGIVRDGRRLARRADEPPPAAPKRLLDYLGEYGWDHNVLYAYEDGGRLCCLIEWFWREPLIEVDGDRRGRFRMADSGLYAGEVVDFGRDAAGRVVAVTVGGVRFPRRVAGPEDGATFRIEPRYPIERLRAMAREARMPKQPDDLRPADLVGLAEVDPSVRFDLRYGTTNNFMSTVFYEKPVAYMQRPAALALAQAQAALRERGLGLLIHDAYRPWEVTKMFWDATPEEQKQFVANPASGSRHNRGCAVDLTLCRLDDGEPVPMVSGYDEFTARAYPDYPGGTWRQRWHRGLLRRTMESVGFSVYEWEWWHFDHADWRSYPILNRPLR